MRPNITITIPTPYLPIDEYCHITGTPMGTARDMVRDGRLPIRGKGDKPRARVEINMVALTVQALSECNIALNA
ncbi:regulator [Enterobacter wuhouensis]|uniref:regulator n=1 Tax=Enterobacter wuhouensis TaxID=2529381 RepID=UPI003D781892